MKCPHCGATFPASAAGDTEIQTMQSAAQAWHEYVERTLPPRPPWVCVNCHDSNHPGRMTCARCGFARDAV